MPEPSPPELTQVTISPETIRALQEIAAQQDISLSAALQQAVSVGHLLVEADRDKDTSILLKKGNQIQELKLLPGNRG